MGRGVLVPLQVEVGIYTYPWIDLLLIPSADHARLRSLVLRGAVPGRQHPIPPSSAGDFLGLHDDHIELPRQRYRLDDHRFHDFRNYDLRRVRGG